MIIIESKRKKSATILKKYPDAILADVTSSAKDGLVKLSPFYPHGGCDVDTSLFDNDTMKGLKRTVMKYGKPLGHRKGVNGTELLGYIEARKQIYIPTYRWVLENKVTHIIERLREASKTKTIVLLDYDTNADVENAKKPLSHASLIKAYVEGIYPYGDKPIEKPKEEPKKATKKKKTKKEDNNTQLDLFNE